MNHTSDTLYIAVRKASDDGHEFFDVRTLSHGKQTAGAYGMEADKTSPNYAAANPVIRIAAAVLVEK